MKEETRQESGIIKAIVGRKEVILVEGFPEITVIRQKKKVE